LQASGKSGKGKNLDNSYFSLSLKGQVMVGTMENSRYAISGKLESEKKNISDEESPVFSFKNSDAINLLKP
jgi:hypothetical protein